jgi:polysaccharide biosynthesis protein PslG
MTQPFAKLFGVATFSLWLTTASVAAATEYVIDDFSGASSPAPWVFSNGPEFPGATGSLASGPGIMGKGAALAYDFAGGGNYVAMTLTLPKPLVITALGYAANTSNVRTGLRVVDTTGQTLQYDVNRPLEAGGPTAWYQEVVDLTAPTSFFGGANDGTLHEPVTAVSLLADDSLQSGRVGVVGIDSVVAWDVLPAVLDPDQTPLPPPSGAADLASRLGVNIHFTSDNQALDIIAAAGFSRVRMDLGWQGVETTKGVYDFSAFDALVSALASRGLVLHLILDYFNDLYPTSADPGYLTTTVPAFAAVSKAAAAHFAGKNVTFEVWNEENGGFWDPSANAAQYSALSSAAIAAVHSGSSSALVTTGGLAGFDDPFLEAMLDAGGAVGANAVGVHPYRQGGAESASDDLAFMRSIVASALSPAPPVWDTEWGYSSQWFGPDGGDSGATDGGDGGGHAPSALALQAQRVSRELLTAWALGFPMAIYYDIRDDGTDPNYDEDNFGLIHNDYSDKPAIVAVRTLTKAASGRTFSGFLSTGFTSMHAMLLVGPKDRIVALWSDAAGTVTQVSCPSTASATDMLGAPLPLTVDGGAASVTVSEVAGPVFLTIPNPSEVKDAGGDASADAGKGHRDASMPPRDAAATLRDAAIDAPGTSARETSGCGCRVGVGETAPAFPFLFAGALGLLVALRRRDRPLP